MDKKNTKQKLQFLSGKTEPVVVFLLTCLYFLMALFGRGTFWSSFETVNLYFILLTLPFVFILNTYLLVPLFFKKGRWLYYIFGILIVQLLLEYLRAAFTTDDTSVLFGRQNTVTSFMAGVVVSWVFVLIRDWMIHLREIEKLKSEKLRSELDFLKVQVDPHFLFNTLNSMYALALEENSPKTADSIIKLSALMRYNLHDSNEELIPLKKETEYIEKYIALQKLRLNENNKVEVTINFDNEHFIETKIAPLLLIPFVENVFKYGVSPSKSTEISIHIFITDNFLELKTINDIVEPSANIVKNGVGLRNVKNRLELLYATKYELTYGANTSKYYVHLKIKL